MHETQADGNNLHLSTVTRRSCSNPAPVLTRIQLVGGHGGVFTSGLSPPCPARTRNHRIHALVRNLNIPISALSGSDLRMVNDGTQLRIDE